MSADASLIPPLLRGLLMYVVLPAWLLAGWGDWLCHRRAQGGDRAAHQQARHPCGPRPAHRVLLA